MPPAIPVALIMVGRTGGDVERTEVDRWTEVVGDIAANGSPSFDQILGPLVLGFMDSGNRSEAVVSEVVLDRPPARNDRDVVDVDGYRVIDEGIAVLMQQKIFGKGEGKGRERKGKGRGFGDWRVDCRCFPTSRGVSSDQVHTRRARERAR